MSRAMLKLASSGIVMLVAPALWALGIMGWQTSVLLMLLAIATFDNTLSCEALELDLRMARRGSYRHCEDQWELAMRELDGHIREYHSE